MPVRDLAVDVFDADRTQGDPAAIQPVEEMIDRVAATVNCLLGPAPLRAHPACEDCDLVGMRVPRQARLLREHVRETQPPHRAADKRPSGDRRRMLAEPAHAGP